MKLTTISVRKFSSLTSAERRPSAQRMGEALRAAGVTLENSEISAVGRSTKRLNALHQLDFPGEKTAFEHILDLANAGQLKDNTPSGPLAADLFKLMGAARSADFGKCYARTSHTIYSVHHPGEMSRIIASLSSTGKVTMADGTTVHWDPEMFSITSNYSPQSDMLWGALNHLLRKKTLPKRPTLSSEQDSAYNGEMSNLTSRLTGVPHVNVDGDEAMKHLNAIVDLTGPVLAEYGYHGGSLAKVVRDKTYSLEEGNIEPTQELGLGYVVVPKAEAEARGLKPLEYPGEATGYMKRNARKKQDD